MSRSALIAGCMFLAAGLLFWIRYKIADIVWTAPIAEELSPDKAWKATVEETTVEGLMMTDVVAGVYLVSSKQIVRPLASLESTPGDTMTSGRKSPGCLQPC